MVKSEKGIKFSPFHKNPAWGAGRPAKYPWKTMKVGESFFIKNGYTGSVGYPNNRLAPKHFRARSVKGGVRVWRVK